MKSKLPTFESPFESYKAMEKIGEGGSGRVFQCVDSSDAIYAVKTLSPERLTSEKLKRFKNEIGFCQKNNHKNILKISDVGVLLTKEVKCPFYVMPRYSGTLRSNMKNLELHEILPVYSQILNGVEAAHLLGVWHRDIKPENILMDTESLVVADFGIAHFAEDEIVTAVETKLTSRMANYLYAAPEQKVKGRQVDQRADIYALGLLLSEMFTGEIPQGAGVTSISSISQEYSYLDNIVSEMIQQNPDNRPTDIQSIKEGLISRRNEFVALQKLSASKREVVESSAPGEFTPINITGLDYESGILILKLSAAPPQRWQQEFSSSGGVRIVGFEPRGFRFQGNTVAISGVGDDEKLIQKLVDYSKQYVSSGNNGYKHHLQEQAKREEQAKRDALREKIDQEEKRVNALDTLSKIKL